VANRLGIGLVKANEVEVVEDHITGEVRIDCGFHDKGSILRQIAGQMEIPLPRCASVGDDDNDISMFEAVPFSVAYNPKSSRVEDCATSIVRGRSLDPVRLSLLEHFRSLGG
jgi:phosphoserine phosphatase